MLLAVPPPLEFATYIWKLPLERRWVSVVEGLDGRIQTDLGRAAVDQDPVRLRLRHRLQELLARLAGDAGAGDVNRVAAERVEHVRSFGRAVAFPAVGVGQPLQEIVRVA